MVKLHGRWCGPNWTDGRSQDAPTYKANGGNFTARAIDPLDKICRTHDKSCSGADGCSVRGNLAMVRSIDRFLANPMNGVKYPTAYLKAPLIKAGILAATPFVGR